MGKDRRLELVVPEEGGINLKNKSPLRKKKRVGDGSKEGRDEEKTSLKGSRMKKGDRLKQKKANRHLLPPRTEKLKNRS